MINHARTLLLNQAPKLAHPSDIGYEYIPPAFKPLALPTTLNTIHRIIYGNKPDNYFRNYRTRELLGYIHQTELAEYVYRLDPRVTYWHETNKNFWYGPTKKIYVQHAAGKPSKLTVSGTANASNALGRSEYDYRIVFGYKYTQQLIQPRQRPVLLSQVENAQPVLLVQPVPETTEPVITTFENATTLTPVQLPETQLYVRLNTEEVYGRVTTELEDIFVVEDYSIAAEGDILVEQPEDVLAQLNIVTGNAPIDVVQAAWNVSAQVNPTSALVSVLPNLEFLGEPLYLELFDVAPKEPYATFRNLWQNHPLPAYRLSGIVLAFIYRINELLRS